MASKFQNRLVGTIIIVALGVIILPGLLDGKKKHYKEEFAAIPLVPKPGDQQESDIAPPVTQALPAKPPEGAGSVIRGTSGENRSRAESGSTTPYSDSPPSVVAPPPISTPQRTMPEKPKTVVKNTERSIEKAPPAGQAYVVQLGALKNAAKVNEIIAKLRLSGYRAFTLPSTAVQGKVTRIYVGPNTSKATLQAAVGELHEITGLNGVVKPYSPR